MRRVSANIFILLLLFGWIVPVAYFGFTDAAAPWIPDFLTKRTNVSRLFFKEQSAFWVYELDYRRNGAAEFETLREEDYFRMRPFGFRTRFQRIMASPNPATREALARWIKTKLDAEDGGNPVQEIRILRFAHHANAVEAPSGHYTQPRRSDLVEAVIYPIANFEY